MGILSTPIKGTVEVTHKDVTIDADLGLLERFFPMKQARTAIEGRIRELLQMTLVTRSRTSPPAPAAAPCRN